MDFHLFILLSQYIIMLSKLKEIKIYLNYLLWNVAIILMANYMDLDRRYLKMETHILDSLKMTSFKEMVY
jgi:hypothetical protein